MFYLEYSHTIWCVFTLGVLRERHTGSLHCNTHVNITKANLVQFINKRITQQELRPAAGHDVVFEDFEFTCRA